MSQCHENLFLLEPTENEPAATRTTKHRLTLRCSTVAIVGGILCVALMRFGHHSVTAPVASRRLTENNTTQSDLTGTIGWLKNLLFPSGRAPPLYSEFVIEGLPATGIAPHPVGAGISNRACDPETIADVKPYTEYFDTGPIGCNRKCVEAFRSSDSNCTGIEHDLNGRGEGTCKVFHVGFRGTSLAHNVTCSIRGQGDAAPDVQCPKESVRGFFAWIKDKVNAFIVWVKSLFGGGTTLYPEGAIMKHATKCQDPQMQTQCMTEQTYDAIVSDVGVALEKAKTNLQDCHAGNCPEADWAGCVLRMAGHDFMDFDRATNTGGSDGCTDLNFVDNKGLEPCLISGDHDVALVDIYEKYCDGVSLADFLVIAAEGVMVHTRENVLIDNPTATPVDFKTRFRFGRKTATACHEAAHHLPNPEDGCDAVKNTFVDRMGLSWRESAALMGVHTLGRARPENSGYSGWWSDPDNSRKFNNNYYVSLQRKGWRPMKSVCGNPEKNQWYGSGPGRVKQGEQTEFMLDTDLCLAFSETDPVGGRVTSGPPASKVGAPVSAKRSNCCAWLIKHPRREEPFGLFTEICGLHDIEDCGSITKSLGAAGDAITEFADDEAAWIAAFLPAWTKAVENGFSHLQSLKQSCPR